MTVALQIPGGERIKSVFKSSVTLWDILKFWEAQRYLSDPLCALYCA